MEAFSQNCAHTDSKGELYRGKSEMRTNFSGVIDKMNNAYDAHIVATSVGWSEHGTNVSCELFFMTKNNHIFNRTAEFISFDIAGKIDEMNSYCRI
jgi:hypothetical protein